MSGFSIGLWIAFVLGTAFSAQLAASWRIAPGPPTLGAVGRAGLRGALAGTAQVTVAALVCAGFFSLRSLEQSMGQPWPSMVIAGASVGGLVGAFLVAVRGR